MFTAAGIEHIAAFPHPIILPSPTCCALESSSSISRRFFTSG
jgi:hypothetical protein